MSKGRDKCELLRDIRRQVAEKYGLRYEPQECHHEGDCSGTCKVCDSELLDLQRQLSERGIDNVNIFKEVIHYETKIESKNYDPESGQMMGWIYREH
jgi:hypothetical protein